MENNLNIIVHVKETKEVVLKAVLDAVNVDNDNAVNNEVIEWMGAVYSAKEVSLIDNPKYQKYQDYNGMFFVNMNNYFEVTFDIEHPNDCHVFVGSF